MRVPQLRSPKLKTRGYADKYAADPRPKVLLGINFSSQDKTVADWVMEVVSDDFVCFHCSLLMSGNHKQ